MKDGTQEPTTIVTGCYHRVRGKAVAFREGAPPKKRRPVRRPAKVAVLLALAHRLQEAVDEGVVEHASEAARLLKVSRARVTQILDLALLPVAVQEGVLFAVALDGREPVTERGMRTRRAQWFPAHAKSNSAPDVLIYGPARC